MAQSKSNLNGGARFAHGLSTSIGADPSKASLAINLWLARLPILVIIGLLAAFALRLIFAPTLWLDEAMLVRNLQTISWNELFQPLPFYDQIAPLAYVTLLKTIYALTGLHEGLLRLPSTVALIFALVLALRLPATDATTRLMTAAMIVGSFCTVRLATDAKPYMLETFFALALVSAFHPAARGVWEKSSFRLALLVLAALSTTAFPLVAFAVGAPWILSLFLADMRERRPIHTWHSLVPVALFTIALVFYVIYFTTYLADSLRLVAENHAYGYAADGYNIHSMFYPAWLLSRLQGIVSSHWLGAATLVLLLLAIGLYVLIQQRSLFAAQFTVLAVSIVGLNLTGHFPIMEGRFSMFLLPWLGVLAGVGVSWLTRQISQPLLRQATVTLAALVMLYPAIQTLQDPFHQQTRASLAKIKATPELPLVATIASQPIIDVYLTPGPVNRQDCTVRQAAGTTTRCTAAKAAADGDTFSGADTKWYLLNYVAVSTWNGSDAGFPGASIEAYSAEYYDWLVSELRQYPKAHFLMLQGNPTVMRALQSRLKPTERLSRIVDERPPSPTLAHSAAQLYLFELKIGQ